MPKLRRRILLPAAVAALVALAAPGAASARVCHHTGADPNKVSLHKVQTATLCLINNRRRKRGLPRLSENHRLDLASMRHARDMAAHNFFEHGDFVGRIKRADYLDGAGSWTVGENIAWGGGSYATPGAIVRMWMDSPPHRANILSRRFHEIGIGIARGTPSARVGGGATYATDFGARS
ncbi:MAG TPA: CAP domain-containing protein [Thermoleophilaceae bacterium]|nr:CAP domain-containing protein [Thermoleophilaceae bacterium]